MGSNRRYADKIDRQMDRRIAERELRPGFRSLTPVESGAESERVTEAREPIPVTAWVDVTPGVIKVEAQVTAWTKKAVRIEWQNADGSRTSVWVYAGAVSRK